MFEGSLGSTSFSENVLWVGLVKAGMEIFVDFKSQIDVFVAPANLCGTRKGSIGVRQKVQFLLMSC